MNKDVVPQKSEEAPSRKASSGPLSGLQKKLQELEGRQGAVAYPFDHLLLCFPSLSLGQWHAVA